MGVEKGNGKAKLRVCSIDGAIERAAFLCLVFFVRHFQRCNHNCAVFIQID